MQLSLDEADLAAYVARQISFFSAPRTRVRGSSIRKYLPDTMERLRKCFSQIRKKYYWDGTRTLFDHLHSDHYAMFLYLLSNTIHQTGDPEALAPKVFLLNKALHGADIFYGIQLPEVFLFVHPVGTVLGNAQYGNYFVAYQNCTVGSLEDGRYPSFTGETVLFSRTSVLGDCRIGKNVVIGANSSVVNVSVPDNSVVVGSYPAHKILQNDRPVLDRIFR